MLHAHFAPCSMDFLAKFSPSPSPGSAGAAASFAGALVERMAGRVLVFFVRHASLLRPLSQAGKVQLAKVCAPAPAIPEVALLLPIASRRLMPVAHHFARDPGEGRLCGGPTRQELLPERAVAHLTP